MQYVECPSTFFVRYSNFEQTVFLAGGITGCPDWQTEMKSLLRDTDLVLYNPRRKDFPIDDPSASDEQIRWEHKYLNSCDRILFWFPKDTLCPITLFELGAHLKDDKPIAVGVEPGYARETDVRIQVALERPEITVVSTLHDLAEAIQ